MNAYELTNKLLDDLELLVKAKNVARSPEKLLEDMTAFALGHRENDFSIAEDWISMTCYNSLPIELKRIVSIINVPRDIIELKSGETYDLDKYFALFTEKKESIIENIETILTNKDLVFISHPNNLIPLSEPLLTELENLTNETNRIEKCVSDLKD